MKLEEKYLISGMSCAACSARVNKAVSKLYGVKECNVNLLTNSMVVSYDETVLSSEDIIKAVVSSGYGASLVEKETFTSSSLKEELSDIETPRLIKRLCISLVILIPLFYLSMGFMLGWPIGALSDHLWLLALIEMILALIIMIVNYRFFISGFKAILHRSMNMDTLVMLGSGVAFIYSFVISCILFSSSIQGMDLNHLHMLMMNVSFETCGMVPTLITIGKTLESYSKGKTTNAIKDLIDLSPKTALVKRDGKEVEILVEEVVLDDIFIVKPGMSIPVDGVVIQGESSIDESMLTGESIPVDKSVDSIVKSGTINQNGVLVCKAIRVGKETTLNQIIASVEKAANSKARIAKIADKVSGIFVPVVICISILVFLGWFILGKDFLASHTDIESSLLSYSIERAIAVLVISCPCALGLATPVAIMVGNGKGARSGILFKNAEALEEVGKVDFIILDKTGTITKGTPVVDEVISYSDELLEVAYSLESNSDHPLALAINNYAIENNVHTHLVNDFANVSGRGLRGKIKRDDVYAGNLAFMKENGVEIKDSEKIIEEKSKQGKTLIFFAKNDYLLGIIVISDQIKDEAKDVITAFKKLGIVPVMLTGDNEFAARYIADQVGIDIVISSVLPEGKLEVIELFKKYGKTMMVGDGINDAIALTSAHVGMAIGSGNDVALSSSDVVLMKSDLRDAYAAINLSKYVYLNIKENLFWAFFYNLIMIPIAAGVFSYLGLYKVAPWMGSAAMALSSVFVVLNALRINLFNPYNKKHANKKVIIPPEVNNIDICKIDNEVKGMTKTLKIEGMMCMHCVAHVKKALEEVEGVTSADVSLEKNEAVVSLSKEVSDEVLSKAVEEAGYKVI